LSKRDTPEVTRLFRTAGSYDNFTLAVSIGGLMVTAGNFVGPLCVLQLGAFVPILVLCLRDRKIGSHPIDLRTTLVNCNFSGFALPGKPKINSG
jgi:hypothetical protein